MTRPVKKVSGRGLVAHLHQVTIAHAAMHATIGGEAARIAREATEQEGGTDATTEQDGEHSEP